MSDRADTGRGRTVLVVDDSERGRRLACDVLAHHGFEPVGVDTAEEALLYAATHVPAIALLDIQLPGMDGIHALNTLREDPRWDAVPIVALTAFAMPGDAERFLEHGFDAYMSKPINTRGLVARILEILDDDPA